MTLPINSYHITHHGLINPTTGRHSTHRTVTHIREQGPQTRPWSQAPPPVNHQGHSRRHHHERQQEECRVDRIQWRSRSSTLSIDMIVATRLIATVHPPTERPCHSHHRTLRWRILQLHNNTSRTPCPPPPTCLRRRLQKNASTTSFERPGICPRPLRLKTRRCRTRMLQHEYGQGRRIGAIERRMYMGSQLSVREEVDDGKTRRVGCVE